ncbi:TRAP transporter small permease [Roseibium suaedae]|uniref:TRAP transporter small permease protein n=1 Tax=Roseibium suaedae TaxID=735517 RepID=A0A1M7P5A5_9HYPH|nr:TRAP transporter small permease [Roseibium suaedae]SHN11830.1 TRAP-type C4-dicarboxylate transport system, small permease component [Roseibium suaedae]
MGKPHQGEVEQSTSRLPLGIDLIVRVGGVLSAVLILVMLAVTAVNVVGRYALGNPFRGAEEFTGYLVVALVMAGAAEAYRRGDHIAIDLIRSTRIPGLKHVSNVLYHGSVLAFAVILGSTGWHTVSFSRDFESYSAGYLETPMWIPQSALLLGAFLLALAAFGRLVQEFTGRTGS